MSQVQLFQVLRVFWQREHFCLDVVRGLLG
jgi:hypothetical protein